MSTIGKHSVPADFQPRRIAIVGAGAMGVSLAALVGRRVPVTIVCRDPRKADRLRAWGAQSIGLVEAHSPVEVVHSIAGLMDSPPASFVFITTKTTAIPEVAAELRHLMPLIGDQPGAPLVVSYQNGIDPGRQLMELLDDDRVLRMVVNLGATLTDDPARVRITPYMPKHFIGGLPADHFAPCERLAGVLTEAGLPTQATREIEIHVWAKAILNAAMNPVAALINASVGEVLASPSSTIVDRLLWESICVARADGINPGQDYYETARRILQAAAPHTPSMVQDIRAGRESEVGQLNRQVIAHARRLGISVPTHEVVNALIESYDWKVYQHRGDPGRTEPSGKPLAATPSSI